MLGISLVVLWISIILTIDWPNGILVALAAAVAAVGVVRVAIEVEVEVGFGFGFVGTWVLAKLDDNSYGARRMSYPEVRSFITILSAGFVFTSYDRVKDTD